ncbi:MAG: hypothetical protein WA252_16125 [Candidatus Sulfotelmatobacter sp.]
MNTPLTALPLSMIVPVPNKKKKVLLVDISTHKRDIRSEVMRKLGIEVDCAADIDEARSWWKADLYDLVLINMERGPGHRDRFCDDVRGATPPQRLAFFVGEPEYIADLPNEDVPSLSIGNADEHVLVGELKAALSADLKNSTHPWSILEASRRISAVRSACSARSRALRDRPAPVRDLKERSSKRTPSKTLDDLLREEMQ